MLRRSIRGLSERNRVPDGRSNRVPDGKKSQKPRTDFHCLTLQERIAVIQEFETFPNPKELARKYQCSETQIRSIIRRRDVYLEEWENNGDPTSRRLHRTIRKKMIEMVVLEWVRRCNASQIPFDNKKLMHVATKMANCLNITDHKSSSDWIARFKKQHKLQFEVCYPEERGKSLDLNEIIEELRPELEAINGGKEIENRFRGGTGKGGWDENLTYSSKHGSEEGSVRDHQFQSESQSEEFFEGFSIADDITENYSMAEDMTQDYRTADGMTEDLENFSIDTYEQALEVLSRIEQFAMQMNGGRAVHLIRRVGEIFRREAGIDE